jgi:hypothetical protein
VREQYGSAIDPSKRRPAAARRAKLFSCWRRKTSLRGAGAPGSRRPPANAAPTADTRDVRAAWADRRR